MGDGGSGLRPRDETGRLSTLNGEFVTTSDAAAMLGLSRQHTIRLARAGKLKHQWTPLGRLFRKDEVVELKQTRDADAARKRQVKWGIPA